MAAVRRSTATATSVNSSRIFRQIERATLLGETVFGEEMDFTREPFSCYFYEHLSRWPYEAFIFFFFFLPLYPE